METGTAHLAGKVKLRTETRERVFGLADKNCELIYVSRSEQEESRSSQGNIEDAETQQEE